MRDKLYCVIYNTTSTLFRGEINSSDIDLPKLFANCRTQEPISLVLGRKTITGKLNEVYIKFDKAFTPVLKIILEWHRILLESIKYISMSIPPIFSYGEK